MERKSIALTAVLIVLFMAGSVSAAPSSLVPDPLSKNINVGNVGTYTLKLNTDYSGAAHLTVDTGDAHLFASIEKAGDPTGSSDKHDFTSTGGGSGNTQTFALKVKPADGVTVNTEYDISVWFYQGSSQDVSATPKAFATAGTIPTPEIATVGLVGLGIIGLVLLKRRSEKG